VYTTCASVDEAKSIAMMTISERMAVCADFWAIQSIYPWKNVIEEVDQYMLMLTTQKILAEKLVGAIERVHSYSVPTISVCETQLTSQPYRFWADQTIDGSDTLLTPEEAAIQKSFEDEGGYHPGHLK
jgi:periplasmic divalent cation tolerance protein